MGILEKLKNLRPVSKKQLGQNGEDFVAEKLLKGSWHIDYRNFKTPYGEIDIVARKGREMRILEVKTRRLKVGQSQPEMLELISSEQRIRLQRAARWLWEKNGQRFDVVGQLVAIFESPTGRVVKTTNLPLLSDDC